MDCHLLSKALRVEGNRSGYLFFDTLGQVYHLPDEAIIPAECAWQPFDFKQSNMLHSAVTFNFPRAESGDNARVCLMGTLTRYPYFQKLFEQWQEGASAKVEITDIEPNIFEHLLSYVHTAVVDCDIGLAMLTKLLVAANKYMMEDLAACSLLRILEILSNRDSMLSQEAEAFADLLAFSEIAVQYGPTLQKKVIFAILVYRKGVISHPEFLKCVQDKCPTVLPTLLAPVVSALGHSDLFEGDCKRRKLNPMASEVRRSLWH
eukprot:TRINITY_DN50436_c0_g1_i1.p1 TRINITY_DN50436_c0_g1~~TRINITY_DN50436_c0_g1_i1.p1  ORF type:complete len:297 (-),score=42.19 TRINITY_DN50436_c0_g1_i1:149-934(-)